LIIAHVIAILIFLWLEDVWLVLSSEFIKGLGSKFSTTIRAGVWIPSAIIIHVYVAAITHFINNLDIETCITIFSGTSGQGVRWIVISRIITVKNWIICSGTSIDSYRITSIKNHTITRTCINPIGSH
jgi:hypothetical protein